MGERRGYEGPEAKDLPITAKAGCTLKTAYMKRSCRTCRTQKCDAWHAKEKEDIKRGQQIERDAVKKERKLKRIINVLPEKQHRKAKKAQKGHL